MHWLCECAWSICIKWEEWIGQLIFELIRFTATRMESGKSAYFIHGLSPACERSTRVSHGNYAPFKLLWSLSMVYRNPLHRTIGIPMECFQCGLISNPTPFSRSESIRILFFEYRILIFRWKSTNSFTSQRNQNLCWARRICNFSLVHLNSIERYLATDTSADEAEEINWLSIDEFGGQYIAIIYTSTTTHATCWSHLYGCPDSQETNNTHEMQYNDRLCSTNISSRCFCICLPESNSRTVAINWYQYRLCK